MKKKCQLNKSRLSGGVFKRENVEKGEYRGKNAHPFSEHPYKQTYKEKEKVIYAENV